MRVDASDNELVVSEDCGSQRCRRLKQYVYVLQAEAMTDGSEEVDSQHVYMQEVDDTLVVKVLKDDYAGRQKAEQLREYVEDYLEGDDDA